jgi:hypothetical protein
MDPAAALISVLTSTNVTGPLAAALGLGGIWKLLLSAAVGIGLMMLNKGRTTIVKYRREQAAKMKKQEERTTALEDRLDHLSGEASSRSRSQSRSRSRSRGRVKKRKKKSALSDSESE